MPRPNFFIVGAAKSGTTALWYYLGQHPDCYLAPVKEPHRWATDLGLSSHPFIARHPELFFPRKHQDFWSSRMSAVEPGLGRDAESYGSLFASVEGQTAIGEASPSYLLSRDAATLIATAYPGARIVILLRHPVDVMHSLHAMLRLGALEPHWSFAAAVNAARSRHVLAPPGHQVWTRYHDVVRFAPQVRRYLDVFPRSQVHISLFDDLKEDPAGWLANIQTFLGLGVIRPTDMRVINDSRVARSMTLQRVLLDPPRRWRSLMERMPDSLRVQLLRMNWRAVRRDPMSPDDWQQLTREFEPDIRELEDVIERDLSNWLVS